jgi:hypothetical protein
LPENGKEEGGEGGTESNKQPFLIVCVSKPHLSPIPFHLNLPSLDKDAALALAYVQNTFRRPQMHLALLLLIFLRARFQPREGVLVICCRQEPIAQCSARSLDRIQAQGRVGLALETAEALRDILCRGWEMGEAGGGKFAVRFRLDNGEGNTAGQGYIEGTEAWRTALEDGRLARLGAPDLCVLSPSFAWALRRLVL